MLDGRIIAFKPTADLDRARQFYGDVLGLRFVQQSPFACVFDVEGTMLRVTAVDTVARPGYTVLGWHVVEVSATIDALTASAQDALRCPASTLLSATRPRMRADLQSDVEHRSVRWYPRDSSQAQRSSKVGRETRAVVSVRRGRGDGGAASVMSTVARASSVTKRLAGARLCRSLPE